MNTSAVGFRTKTMITEIVSFLVLNAERNKVKNLVPYALNFEGVFASSDGNEIILETDASGKGVGRFTKVGASMCSITIGDEFCRNMQRINENTWKGLVREKNSGEFNFLYYGDIIIHDNNNLLTAIPISAAHYSYTRIK